MQRTGVSAVTAYTAHREWATRPPDERFASVSALYEAARVRRARTEERTIETHQVWTAAETDDDLVVREASGHTAPLTHWSFEQLAAIAGAPPNYLRTLPAPIASSAINVGLERQHREGHQLFADRDAPWTVHAITSPRYARVHHDELAARVLDLLAEHPTWTLPLGYKDGVYGAELVPSGAYLGDRDMFLLLVDGDRNLEDPTDVSHGGLFRGFILRNSDVGAAALTLDVFLYRAVCGNNIVWGFQHVAGFRRRHVGASIHAAWTDSLESVRTALDASLADDRAMLLRATTQELGPTREAMLEAVTARLELSRKQATDAYGLAEQFESSVRLGLRARTDTTQSAHTLAGSSLRSRPRRQPTPDHGSLTGSTAVRAQPRGAILRRAGVGSTPPVHRRRTSPSPLAPSSRAAHLNEPRSRTPRRACRPSCGHGARLASSRASPPTTEEHPWVITIGRLGPSRV